LTTTRRVSSGVRAIVVECVVAVGGSSWAAPRPTRFRVGLRLTRRAARTATTTTMEWLTRPSTPRRCKDRLHVATGDLIRQTIPFVHCLSMLIRSLLLLEFSDTS